MRTFRYILVLATLISLLAGCKKFTFGAPENIPDSMELEFSYDWSNGQPASGQMYVIMSRIINTLHYAWRTDDLGTSFIDLTEEKGMVLSRGEYYLVSFSSSDRMKITGLDEFISSTNTSMKEIKLSVDEATDEEIAAILGESSPDFNPLFPYIPDVGPIYIEVQKIFVTHTMDTHVVMVPESLTQDITFRVGIELEDGVVLENVAGEISGVGGTIEAMSGYIDKTQTYRSMFTMTESSVSGNTHYYEGTIHALGLFPSIDSNYITGPGIMHLSIQANDGEGNTKIFHAGINLRETILSAGLTEEADGGLFRVAKKSAVLNVQTRLVITKGQIVPGDGQGIEIWFDSDENFVDTEV